MLFGYEPLYAQAWGSGATVSNLVVPGAHGRLALAAAESTPKPLGHDVWVFDASGVTNRVRRQAIPLVTPGPEFETAVFGPFLVIRSTRPTGCVAEYLEVAVVAARPSLRLGAAGTNRDTVLQAERLLRAEKHPSPC